MLFPGTRNLGGLTASLQTTECSQRDSTSLPDLRPEKAWQLPLLYLETLSCHGGHLDSSARVTAQTMGQYFVSKGQTVNILGAVGHMVTPTQTPCDVTAATGNR